MQLITTGTHEGGIECTIEPTTALVTAAVVATAAVVTAAVATGCQLRSTSTSTSTWRLTLTFWLTLTLRLTLVRVVLLIWRPASATPGSARLRPVAPKSSATGAVRLRTIGLRMTGPPRSFLRRRSLSLRAREHDALRVLRRRELEHRVVEPGGEI